MKPLADRWAKLTDEVLEELYRASAALVPRRLGKTDVAAVAPTWESYLKEIGLDRMTAYRWLRRWDPVAKRRVDATRVSNARKKLLVQILGEQNQAP
jgi:hypothetical protein